MDREPDFEATVTFLSKAAGGRKTPARSGYRPAHAVRDDYLTTGVQRFLDREWAAPGETVRAHITFVSPEHYPHCLWPGKVINVQEASHVVGHAEIIRVFNLELLATQAE